MSGEVRFEVRRHFADDIDEVNKNNQVKINTPSLDNFARRILSSSVALKEGIRAEIVEQISNESAKTVISYLLGISKVVPNLVREELKLKYSLLNSYGSFGAYQISELVSSFNRRPDVVKKLLGHLEGKKFYDTTGFAKVIERFDNKKFEDFQKLLNQKTITIETGDDLISILNDIFKADEESMEFVCQAAEKVGSLTSDDLHWYMGSIFELSKKKEWKKLMEQAFDLLSRMDSEVNFVNLIHAMFALEDVEEGLELINILPQLKKGMGECVEYLIPIFNEVPQKEWSEIVEAFHQLACENSCDNLAMIKAIAKGRSGERMDVAHTVNTFIAKLQKNHLYGSEKGYLFVASAEVLQKNRLQVLECVFKVYVQFLSVGREINGVELAEMIQAFALLGKPSEVLESVLSQINKEVDVSEIRELIKVLSRV